MKDSNNIIEITPSFIFFNFRGNGCYVSNSPKEDEKETYTDALDYLASHLDTDQPEVVRAKKEVEEQIGELGQLYLF
jgi:hypothetical protein